MSIKPILFNTDMVRAILDGRKTVTRRLIKPQPTYSSCDGFTWKGAAYGTDIPPTIKGAAYNLRCAAPYQPGDILYVRETWCSYHMPDGSTIYEYRASDPNGNRRPTGTEYDEPWETRKWNPSIHMPKEAARIFLKVKDVRVERLQNIDDKGAYYEGTGRKDVIYQIGGIVCEFAKLWNSTIKRSDLDRYGWDASPWVWVIEFEQCEKPEGW